MRRGALAAALVIAAGLGAAHAGDTAERIILGFSPDGAVFAFEEFGVQDASGFPYSTIYLIDTDRDAWLPDTPVRVVIEDEAARLADARADAAAKAAPLLARYQVAPAGRIVASNPSSELAPDPHTMRFLADLHSGRPDHAWRLAVETYPLPLPDCDRFDLGASLGYRLTLASPSGERRLLNEDKAIPASRGCPQDYTIADVVTYFPEGREPVMVVLLHVVRLGFETPDIRFLAVATRFQAE